MTEYSFTERAPYEAGFADLFQREIVPILQKHESERKTLKSKAIKGMGIAGALGVGGVGAGIGFEAEIGAFISGGLGAFGTYGVKHYYESSWKSALGEEVLPILCEFLGDMSYGAQQIQPGVFENLGVVPNYNEMTLEDPVSGTHKGLHWAMTEASLRRRTRDSKGRNKTTTVFRGLLFQIMVDHPAPKIFFGKDRGSMLNWVSESWSSARKDMEKIEIDDAEFEEVYEVYTDNPEAAKNYVVDQVIWGMKQLAKEEAGGKKYIGAAFHGDLFYLALPRKGDFLGLGSLFKPLNTLEEDLHQALSDLDLPRRMIDALTGR